MPSPGRSVYARVVNQTVTTALELVWKSQNGDTVVLKEGNRIHLVDVMVSTAGTAKDVILFQDNDAGNDLDTGEEIIPPLEFPGQGTIGMPFGMDVSMQPINAGLTNNLHIIASTTGTVSALITARITDV